MTDNMDDEFDEFDLTEAEIDVMMASGTPVEIVTLPFLASQPSEPYVIVDGPVATYGPTVIVADVQMVSMLGTSTDRAVVQTVSLAG